MHFYVFLKFSLTDITPIFIKKDSKHVKNYRENIALTTGNALPTEIFERTMQ